MIDLNQVYNILIIIMSQKMNRTEFFMWALLMSLGCQLIYINRMIGITNMSEYLDLFTSDIVSQVTIGITCVAYVLAGILRCNDIGCSKMLSILAIVPLANLYLFFTPTGQAAHQTR
jgi:uncharacterized membrane protein YhaH (DUF805 family)